MYIGGQLRVEKGLTIDELSKKANVSAEIIKGLETMKITVVPSKTLFMIAQALECDIRELAI